MKKIFYMVNLFFVSMYINVSFAQESLTLRCKGIVDIEGGTKLVRDLHIDFSKKTYLSRVWSDANSYIWDNDDEWSREMDVESISEDEIVFYTSSRTSISLDRYEGTFIMERDTYVVGVESSVLKCEKLHTPTPNSKTRKF